MRVYLKRMNTGIDAVADYDECTKECIVLKGSVINTQLSESITFRATDRIKEQRKQVVKNGIVQEDIKFKSASTAANFVTGVSSNGLVLWKNENGKTIKELLSVKE